MPARLSRRTNYRQLLLFIALALGLLSVAGRLILIQGVDARKFDEMALRQRLRRVELAPYRGTIYDRNQEELAISIGVGTIFATPYLIRNPNAVAQKISPILGIEKKEIIEKLKKKSGFVYLARKIELANSNAIEAQKIEGIGILKESKRVYPTNSLGAQVIGFAGMDNEGLSGLELYYDRVLRGNPGQLIAEKDPLGRSIPGGILYLSPPTNGKSIILTLDKTIQYKAEQELREAIKKYRAKSGMLIVMQPKTGEILAMANEPSFDLNSFASANPEFVRNRSVTDLYEPGSTMKTVIAAAALEEKLASPASTFFLPSTITVANKVINEAHERPAQNFTFTEIVSKSSNVGAVTVGLKLGRENIYNYVKAFGLIEKTGIDFPGEARGFIPVPENWSGTTIGTVPFGQGLSATALQMLRAIAAIGNDGIMVKPYLVSRIVDSKGKKIMEESKGGSKRVISSETARELSFILKEAVDKGTGQNAKLVGYQVAGKTGTAQKPMKNGRGYEPGKYIASFVGFVPANDPQLSIIVVIDEPKDAIWGSVVAAPVFKNIAEFSLNRLKIPPLSQIQ